LNILRPRVLKEATCRITEAASATKMPPKIKSKISCLARTEMVPKAPPKARAHVSPIKT